MKVPGLYEPVKHSVMVLLVKMIYMHLDIIENLRVFFFCPSFGIKKHTIIKFKTTVTLINDITHNTFESQMIFF